MIHSDVAVETAKAAPMVGYGTLYIAGVSIADVVSIVMLVYGICLVIITAPKAYNQIKSWVKSWRSKQD